MSLKLKRWTATHTHTHTHSRTLTLTLTHTPHTPHTHTHTHTHTPHTHITHTLTLTLTHYTHTHHSHTHTTHTHHTHTHTPHTHTPHTHTHTHTYIYIYIYYWIGKTRNQDIRGAINLTHSNVQRITLSGVGHRKLKYKDNVTTCNQMRRSNVNLLKTKTACLSLNIQLVLRRLTPVYTIPLMLCKEIIAFLRSIPNTQLHCELECRHFWC